MNDAPELLAPPMALAMAADLQDNLLTAASDLGRLQALLDHSHESLQCAFFGALQALQGQPAARLDEAALGRARGHVLGATKALQFQDLATQLISHTSHCLHNCADRLARDVFAGDGDAEAAVEPAPQRANPVGQTEMATGFVELF